MTPLLTLHGVEKHYASHEPPRLHEQLGRALGLWNDEPPATLRALQGVTLEVAPGDFVGIMGTNGSSKTTLLRLALGILAPDAGERRLTARARGILELCGGMHSELTVRENLYLLGRLWGMRASDLRASWDDLLRFSGLEESLDRPLKRCSSGQQLRVALSLALHTVPELLVLDEVFAVADATFQAACLESFHRLCDAGGAILWASHDVEALREHCTRALWLNHGQIVAEGRPDEVAALYREHLQRTLGPVVSLSQSDTP